MYILLALTSGTEYFTNIFNAVAESIGELWTQLNNFFTAYVIPFFEQIADFLSKAIYYILHPLQTIKDFIVHFGIDIILSIKERFLSVFPSVDFSPLQEYLDELFNNTIFDNSVGKVSMVITGIFYDAFSGDGEWFYMLLGLSFGVFFVSIILRAIIEIFG